MAAKKGIYHSELEALTKDSPVTIVLEKAPKEGSRNKDIAGFVTITDWNGEANRYVNIENANVLATLQQAPIGAPIQIRAGGKGPEAWLQVMGQGAGSAPSPAAAPAPAPANGTGPGAPAAHGANQGPLARQYFACLQAAHDVVGAFLGQHESDYSQVTENEVLRMVQATAASLFIEQNKGGGTRPLTKEG